MEKSPAFQFYPKDFLMDDKVAIMNMEARGVYITLLSYCWNNKGLSNDQEELKQMCGYPKNWDKIWEKVGTCFYVKGGKLFNKRLDKEARKQKKWKEKSSKGGKESAKVRWGNRGNNKGGYKKVTTKEKAKGNSPSSSSSSSSNNKGKEIHKEKKIDFTKEMLQFFEQEFKRFWDDYDPRGKKNETYAKKRFIALCKTGELPEFDKGYTGYSNYLKDKRINEGFDQKPKYFSTLISDYKEYIGFEYKPPK